MCVCVCACACGRMDVRVSGCPRVRVRCLCGYVTEGCGTWGLLKVFQLLLLLFLKKTQAKMEKICVCDRLSAIEECLSQCRVGFAVISWQRLYIIFLHNLCILCQFVSCIRCKVDVQYV